MYLLFTCPVQLCSWACLSATQEGSLLPRVLRCALIRADSWICSPVLLPITRSFVLIFTSYVLVEQWAVWLSNRRHSFLCLFCISYKKLLGWWSHFGFYNMVKVLMSVKNKGTWHQEKDLIDLFPSIGAEVISQIERWPFWPWDTA